VKTARIITNGQYQTVILPEEYLFDTEEVFINKLDNVVLLIPKKGPWSSLANSLDKFSDDFLESRPVPAAQKREEL
jgi:antitoxin VapB